MALEQRISRSLLTQLDFSLRHGITVVHVPLNLRVLKNKFQVDTTLENMSSKKMMIDTVSHVEM